MNIYDVAELQQYLNPQFNQQSTQLVDPSMLLPQRSPSLGIQSQRLVDPLTLMPQIRGGIMTQAPLQNLGFDTSFGVANEEDVEQEFLPNEKSGIAKLFDFLTNFIPGVGLVKRLTESGGIRGLVPGGIRSLNQRLRNTDFGRSKNLMDYLDIKSYGGYDEREDARAATMAQARGIQKKIDRGEFGTRDRSIDRGRGSIPSRTTSAPKRSFSSDYSAAQRARKF